MAMQKYYQSIKEKQPIMEREKGQTSLETGFAMMEEHNKQCTIKKFEVVYFICKEGLPRGVQ